MKYIHGSPSETYCAPILGNGEISLQIGADGSMSPDSCQYRPLHLVGGTQIQRL